MLAGPNMATRLGGASHLNSPDGGEKGGRNYDLIRKTRPKNSTSRGVRY